MTNAEYDRIDDDGEGGVLDCPSPGQTTWDYGPTGPDEARGRKAEDALLDAITDLNEDAVSEGATTLVPRTGWVELTSKTDAGSATFVHTIDNWQFLIRVGGNRELGVWRHHSALVCPRS